MNLQRCCGGPSTVARKGYDAIGLYPVHTAPFPRSVVEAQQGRRLRTGVVPVSALSLSAADGQTKSHNAPEVGKASLHHAQLDADDDGELFDDDDELEIPPLPKELLQLLSEMLSSSSNSDCGDEETLSRVGLSEGLLTTLVRGHGTRSLPSTSFFHSTLQHEVPQVQLTRTHHVTRLQPHPVNTAEAILVLRDPHKADPRHPAHPPPGSQAAAQRPHGLGGPPRRGIHEPPPS